MIIEFSILTTLIIFLLILVYSKSETINYLEYSDSKEQQEFERTEQIKQSEHDREIEKIVVEKHFAHLADYAKIEEARRPYPLPPVTINVENVVIKEDKNGIRNSNN